MLFLFHAYKPNNSSVKLGRQIRFCCGAATFEWAIWKWEGISVNVLLVSKFFYDGVIKWKHFPRYWLFVREIHRSPVNFLHKGQWREALMFSFICLNKRLSKQSSRRWFETPLRSLWRHGNSTYLKGSGTACLPPHHDQRFPLLLRQRGWRH